MGLIKITETPYWIVELNSDQAYLGRCYISLKRPCGDLAELGEDEILDFLNLVKAMENSLKKSFGAIMFNVGCLMNNAYKSENPRPQVHWHFIPRYNHAVEVGGTEFKDAEFAHHYNNNRHFNTGPEVLNKIAEEIRRNL